jgi:hypothetical protein
MQRTAHPPRKYCRNALLDPLYLPLWRNVHSVNSLIVLQYLDSIFRVHITQSAPDSRSRHRIPSLAYYKRRPLKYRQICRYIRRENRLNSTRSNQNQLQQRIELRQQYKDKNTLLIVVGCTSAEGNEKSQNLRNVFGGGSEIYR